MGTKEQALTAFAAADPQSRGVVVYNGWAYAGAEGQAYIRITTTLSDTVDPAFDPEALADAFENSAYSVGSDLEYEDGGDGIDVPNAGFWWWYAPGWSGWPTKWEEWQDSPNRTVHPVYAAPLASPMLFDATDAQCLMWPGSEPE